jgi:molybdopterin-biosynthesis enzyme MoeA-like protein
LSIHGAAIDSRPLKGRGWPHQGPEQRVCREYLTALGIDLKEVRVVGDEERAIVDALNALRHRCTYVLTTGGIGPTHGDITADCVAKAFGVPIDCDPRALEILDAGVASQVLGHTPQAHASTIISKPP